MLLVDLLLLIPAAFLAGVLMFLAPCTLPVVPAYLAFIAGGQPARPDGRSGGGRVVRNALAFVIGFSLIFILLGISAGLLGSVIAPWRELLVRIAGLLFIFFGLTMLGTQLPILSYTRAISPPKFLTIGRPESSFLVGTLFATGWSPCIGPVLGAILLYASIEATALLGAFLLAVFSLGLAVPFLLSAVFLDKISALFAQWGRFTQVLSSIAGIVLIGLGVLMLTNTMGLLITWGYGLFDFLGYERLLEYL